MGRPGSSGTISGCARSGRGWNPCGAYGVHAGSHPTCWRPCHCQRPGHPCGPPDRVRNRPTRPPRLRGGSLHDPYGCGHRWGLPGLQSHLPGVNVRNGHPFDGNHHRGISCPDHDRAHGHDYGHGHASDPDLPTRGRGSLPCDPLRSGLGLRIPGTIPEWDPPQRLPVHRPRERKP